LYEAAGVLGAVRIRSVPDMHRFLIVIEDAGANFSAYSPDLPAFAEYVVVGA
jgi:hypothetical protein